ncbi:amidohydrolase family protein [Nocardia jiangxiensis]|uniref:Amidohydrolase family protein n=1 Tax=Nocardia jiangxiensis TaxID=282685 RepID=A0ABW6S6P1_9NOCA
MASSREFPELAVVLEEGGLAWAPAQMWALDDMWPILSMENPRLSRAPSEYFREHFYLTTQPIEEPPKRGQLAQTLQHLDMDSHVLFATDYPHWDFDVPARALPREISPELRQRIHADNACKLYRLAQS